MIYRYFFHIGKYLLLLKSLFKKPENWHVYQKELFKQLNDIGIGSLAIVSIISVFVGAVTAVQTAYQLTSGLIPKSVIGSIICDSTLLELAPTITSLVLAGKIGSHVASELATMRVTEQIDALEVMGINVTSYLIMPKILGAVIILPMLIIIAAAFSISGGAIAGILSGHFSFNEFMYGAQDTFRLYNVILMLTKSLTFAFLITSISSYQGFYVKGGALEVGAASTRAVVFSCISILLADFLIADLMI